jgi:hypothetical protein
MSIKPEGCTVVAIRKGDSARAGTEDVSQLEESCGYEKTRQAEEAEEDDMTLVPHFQNPTKSHKDQQQKDKA